MAQLIEAELPLPPAVYLSPGDLLIVKAAGGQLREGQYAVEMLGPFEPATLQQNGLALAPMGSPNTVLFLAKTGGHAIADVVIGDPWFSPQTVEFEIVVES